MCGIVYVRKNNGKPATKAVIKRYENQKHRGDEGFGYLAINGDMLSEYIKTENQKNIFESLAKNESKEIIFHHRYPTSTINTKETAHPIEIKSKSLSYDYYIVHNGVITNDDELKAKHNKEGYEYSTELIQKWRHQKNTIKSYMQYNDSECLGYELAKELDQFTKGSNTVGIPQVRGSIAFICLQVYKNTSKIKNMFFGRNGGNPLKLHHDINILSITSEGQGENIDTDILYQIDYNDKYTIKKSVFTIGTHYVQPTYNYGYRTYDHGYGNSDMFDNSISTNKSKTHDVKDINEYYDLLGQKYHLESERERLVSKIGDLSDDELNELEDIDIEIDTLEFEISKLEGSDIMY